MDNLEHYLNQVCHSIGGPRSLRQHIRQELREHIQDAVAEHKAAGQFRCRRSQPRIGCSARFQESQIGRTITPPSTTPDHRLR